MIHNEDEITAVGSITEPGPVRHISRIQRESVPLASLFPTSEKKDQGYMMLRYLQKTCDSNKWLQQSSISSKNNVGLLFRRSDDTCISVPSYLDQSISEAFMTLDVEAAFTMSSDLVLGLLNNIQPDEYELKLSSSLKIPIVESLAGLAKALQMDKQMNRFAACVCLVRKEKIAFVWHNSAEGLISHGSLVESKLLAHTLGGVVPSRPASTRNPFATPRSMGSEVDLNSKNISRRNTMRQPSTQNLYSNEKNSAMNSKTNVTINDVELESVDDNPDAHDEEALKVPKRPTVLTHAVMISVAACLIVIVELRSLGLLIAESRLDGNWTRMALSAFLVPEAMVSAFFFIVIVGSCFQLIGPLSDIRSNSKTYSANKPKRFRHANLELPHITIQMPVYKEGLKGVIQPTVSSLLMAIRAYEREGGTASIYVNDDGLQLVGEELAQQRIDFYNANGIGYCSRPGHSKESGGFIRRGKFKKASNMNYALHTSILVEDKFAEIQTTKLQELNINEEDITLEDEYDWYEEALSLIIQESEGRTRAGGNIRIGELILIVDCDTRVPYDCLINAAMEMHESPDVAILQHASGVMQVVHGTFENGMTYFTELIYSAIQFSIGHGDVAPFVGHNAFVRWKAIQSISFQEDGVTKFWSESHVSEDFDIALRVQIEGFRVRYASYQNGEFKEGVSLTVLDELSRWKKYSYGCSELVFHPFIYWPTRGPFTPVFYKFIFCKPIHITSKISILAYISTYYAMAAGLPLSLLNYFIWGWLAGDLDAFYQQSWNILLPLLIIFNLGAPLAHDVLQARLGNKSLWAALRERLRWSPLLMVFFGGLSWHLLGAIFCHMFSIDLEFGSTAKELEAGGFYVGLRKIFNEYKYMYAGCFGIIGGMVYLGVYAPYGWGVTAPTTIVPLVLQVAGHMLLPLALGPYEDGGRAKS